MKLEFNIDDFMYLYITKGFSKEDIIKELNITDYIYKKIIKEFNLKRERTSLIKRFMLSNNKKFSKEEDIDIIKIDNDIVDRDEKDDNDIIKRIKKSLKKSKELREN